MTSKFIWNDETGYGYYPVDDTNNVYDKAYFEKYVSYENTPIGDGINKFRIDYVNAFVGRDARVLDIGIGSGYFLKNRPNTLGYDVNHVAVDMLKKKCLYLNPYQEDLSVVKCVTCFDSFEHIKYPSPLLNSICKDTYFVCSIPIFRNKEHALSSKHFRPDEHFHYFTNCGFRKYVESFGYLFCWMSNKETELGRDEIYTYTFYK